MSPALEPMTFDELSELYRVEMKSKSLTPVRPDLFNAMDDLMSRLRLEYEKHHAIDPDSAMCDGANENRRKAEALCKNIIQLRTEKICLMAVLGAMGKDNSLDMLCKDEREYYSNILLFSKNHMGVMNRLKGKRRAAPAPLPEPPAEKEPVQEDRPQAEKWPEEMPPMDDEFEEPVDDMPDVTDDIPLPGIDDRPQEASEDATPAEEPATEAPAPEEPAEEPCEDEPVPEEPVQEPVEEPEPEIQIPEEPEPEAQVPEEPVQEAPVQEPEPEAPAQEVLDEDPDLETLVLIRVLDDVPAFSGPKRDYVLGREDVAMVPAAIASILTDNGLAVPIKVNL